MQEKLRWHSEDSRPQLTEGIFHTSGRTIKMVGKKEEGGDVQGCSVGILKTHNG